MAMRKALFIGIVLAAVASAGCGRSHAENGGPTVSRDYQVGNFDRIEVAGPYNVQVHTGAAASASARGPEKMIERLVVEVKDGKLLIHSQENRGFNFHWGSHRGNVELSVTVPQLSGAAIAGSGDIAVDNVSGDQFAGEVGGSGSISLGAVEVKSIKLSIGGSGGIKAGAGSSQMAEYEIAGSGDIDAGGLAVRQAKVSIAGSGNARANASGTAEVNVMGSGDVEISGGAKCQVNKAGSGDVRCS
jgi:hypothetical protein